MAATQNSVTYSRERLIELIKEHALKFGDFTLASGKKAKFYLDCRKLTLDGEGANQIAAGMLSHIQDNPPQFVGGMAIGADPITGAIITCAWQRGLSLKGFIVRKEAKQHGSRNMVEGPIGTGGPAVIVEDVVTTGGSSLLAIERARAAGLEIDRAFAIIDRQQGAAEKFASVGVQLTALLTIADLGISQED
jgi:orotate phosphoribosyltransferase